MANTEFTTINETPVRVTLTPYEMKTLISSLKHSLETNRGRALRALVRHQRR